MASLARDLKIGERFGSTRSGEPIHIKALHELCIQRPTPHVHVVTSAGSKCLPFTMPVSR
jgi:hypothetical protein